MVSDPYWASRHQTLSLRLQCCTLYERYRLREAWGKRQPICLPASELQKAFVGWNELFNLNIATIEKSPEIRIRPTGTLVLVPLNERTIPKALIQIPLAILCRTAADEIESGTSAPVIEEEGRRQPTRQWMASIDEHAERRLLQAPTVRRCY